MERIRIKAGSFDFVARLESERAPQTCARFRSMLPYKEQIIHVRARNVRVWLWWPGLDGRRKLFGGKAARQDG